jgi:hypothetical protein
MRGYGGGSTEIEAIRIFRGVATMTAGGRQRRDRLPQASRHELARRANWEVALPLKAVRKRQDPQA